MHMEDDTQKDGGGEASVPRPGNHQPQLNRFRRTATVGVAMCLIAVVVLACFLWAIQAHPTAPLDIHGYRVRRPAALTDSHSVAGSHPDTDNYLREVSSVAFSPDGKRIAAGMIFSGGGGVEKEEHRVRVWDAATGRQDLALKGHTASVTSVSFSPDRKRLASASWDNTVKVWDVTKGNEVLTFKGHQDMVTSVAFSPDGTRIGSGCWDCTVKVWDSTSGAIYLARKGHPQPVSTVTFSPDGKRFAASGGTGGNTIKVWDTATGEEMLAIPVCSNHVTFSPDGQRIASARQANIRDDVVYSDDFGAALWDATNGNEILSFKGHTNVVSAVVFSPDGERIASASYDTTVKVWDARKGTEILTLSGHPDGMTSVAFSPDGKHIASGSGDKTVKVWDATTGGQVLMLEWPSRR